MSLRDFPEDLLAERCRAGEAEAFDEACRRHVRRLYGVAWQMLGSRESAWDATQETLLTAWKNRRSFRNEGTLLAWFRGILIRVCWAERRKARHRLELPDHWPGEDGEVTLEIPDARSDPARLVLDQLDRQAVSSALAALPDHYRIPLWLSVHEEMSYADVGRALGIPEGTVKSRINMARRLLRERLDRGEAR
ncbi:MAG: RNA polymerase sigma factor [Methanocella sp.]